MTLFELRFALHQGRFVLEVDVSVSARALVLFGPSGSGKTSLVEAVAGLRQPTGGRIAIDRRVIYDSKANVDVPVRARRMGYVPQDVLLFPHLTVAENITYATGPGAWPGSDNVSELLELETLLGRDVESLSGGERQRVALARALNARPDVLLLDEPLASVDLRRRRAIILALKRIRDELRVPLLYVTHASDEAIAVADHALVVDSGRIVASGPPAEVIPSALASQP